MKEFITNQGGRIGGDERAVQHDGNGDADASQVANITNGSCHLVTN
jgi:hypothetical protein